MISIMMLSLQILLGTFLNLINEKTLVPFINKIYNLIAKLELLRKNSYHAFK